MKGINIRYQNVMKFSKQLWQSYSPFREHMTIVQYVNLCMYLYTSEIDQRILTYQIIFFFVFQDDGNDSDDFMWSKKWQTKCLSSISFRERMGSEVKRKLIKLLVFLIFIAHKQNLSQFSQTPAVSLKFIPLTCYCFL